MPLQGAVGNNAMLKLSQNQKVTTVHEPQIQEPCKAYSGTPALTSLEQKDEALLCMVLCCEE